MGTSFYPGIIGMYAAPRFYFVNHLLVNSSQWHTYFSYPTDHGRSRKPDPGLVIYLSLYPVKRQMELIFTENNKEQQVDTGHNSWK
jgi:hypothetical protein